MKHLLPVCITFILLSCSPRENKTGASDSLKTEVKDDSAQIAAVKNYYTWYNDHIKELYKFDLVKNCPNNGDTTLVYRVNFDETEKWLKAFQSSGLVSGNFITKWRAYFKKCDEELAEEKAWDGPPSGFDYDFIYNSQDDGPTNEQLQKATLIKSETKNGKTNVSLLVPGYYDTLKEVIEKTPDGKWKIAE
jgi:hypothetical protein